MEGRETDTIRSVRDGGIVSRATDGIKDTFQTGTLLRFNIFVHLTAILKMIALVIR